jgi:2',3'-cyclic-nucleotide 2'-phosphodiesterase/3'-nucleotidase/5'-nucleotidase
MLPAKSPSLPNRTDSIERRGLPGVGAPNRLAFSRPLPRTLSIPSLSRKFPPRPAVKNMRFLRQPVPTAILLTAWAVAHCALAQPAAAAVKLQQLWTHDAGGTARAEIVAFDATANEILVGNGVDHCITRLDVHTGQERGRFDVAAYGDPTSVAASHGLVAIAVVAPLKTDPGHVVIFRSAEAKSNANEPNTNDTKPAAIVRVRALPDMVTFTPNGRYILVANEGEPSDDYALDPEGSISVIDVASGPERAVQLTADFLRFNADRDALERQGVRITAPNASAPDGRATLAQDLEPEYIAVAPDGHTAWATLQENNAIAMIDVDAARIERVIPLGLKDHSRAGNGFDASDMDSSETDGPNGAGGARIRPWPVFGMYQPDSIAAFEADGATYVVTANEGDTRGYAGFSDEAIVKDLQLDESLPAELKDDKSLGRLTVSRVGGDTDGDGDVDRLLAFGARSVAVWDADGKLVYDSGDALEQFVATRLPERFNINSEGEAAATPAQQPDVRSPVRGPEPEGLVVGRVGESTYAFVGLERTSAIAIFDVTQPESTRLVDIVPLALQKEAGPLGGPHIAPEGLCFIPADRSPLGVPLLAVGCEVTGTTLLFRVDSVSGPQSGVEWQRHAEHATTANRRRHRQQPHQARPVRSQAEPPIAGVDPAVGANVATSDRNIGTSASESSGRLRHRGTRALVWLGAWR